ncbi:acyl-CoA dehydrogenase family protein [Mycobacterium sp. RTGN5]|uniref:acyl-CoA dehydrogenase family protein n=1 Tax=Mycobacterium sp. RTGN5 TaxID=3016522 RepID=UPI0029C67493|nr:acyl-CoA dehydrogenase family protein [Mycobacterium sp. RTGN5]
MPGEEHHELRENVRAFLEARSPSSAVRAAMETDRGYSRDVWQQLASELGLHGIAVPEEFGGAGAGMTELAVVYEEMGRALLCAPFFSTVAMAIQAVLNSGDDAAMTQLLPTFTDGSTTATLIFNGELAPWCASRVTMTARCRGSVYEIDGSAAMVLDGYTADVILLAARTQAGISLFAVRSTAAGLHRRRKCTLDRTRKVAELHFDGVRADLIGTEGGAEPGLQRTSDLAILALSAEQVGGAQRCLDMAVDYAKQRVQFGRPIGSFQAVKHRCADMLVRVESARSAALHAAQVATAGTTEDLAIAASVAKLYCSETFLSAATDSMRIHGGIGFTWEHDAHLYVRRAKASQLMFGSPDLHAQRLAQLVDDGRSRPFSPV